MRTMSLILGILLLPVTSTASEEFRFPEMSGWKLSGDIQSFTPQNLYEYIDGAADLYLACGFEALTVAEYRDEKKGSVVVEVYRHQTPRDAFGIYSQERLPESRVIAIGAQGYADQDLFIFFIGQYYVKISSFNVGDSNTILQTLARKTEENLSGEKGLPPLLSYFPGEGKKKHSEKYIARNFLGYPFFSGVFTADYELEGSRFTLFLIESASNSDGRRVMQSYLGQLKISEKEAIEGRHTVTDPHHGVIDLYWKGRYLWGAVNLVDGTLRSKYLKRIEQKVKKDP